MNALRLIPVYLSGALAAAHFLRAGQIGPLILVGVLLAGLLVRRRAVALLAQAGLLVAAILWIDTLWTVVTLRRAMGAPWLRLALILGGVAAFTAGSALVFRLRALRERYGIGGHRDARLAGAVLAVVALGAWLLKLAPARPDLGHAPGLAGWLSILALALFVARLLDSWLPRSPASLTAPDPGDTNSASG